MTSKWVRLVQAQRDYTVDWRFISLRLINSAIDYDTHFPAGYEAGHTAGLRLLRVAARTRAEHGRAAIGPLYAALGARIFDTARRPGPGPTPTAATAERGSSSNPPWPKPDCRWSWPTRSMTSPTTPSCAERPTRPSR